MADLRIEKEKAERLVALILREDLGMNPAIANDLSLKICNRVQAAMAVPTKPGLRGYRMIRRYPPHDREDDFTAEIASKLADIDNHLARVLWEMVYERGRDLPDDIVV